jgi:predicted enzyme related to lactoylglutathione lyase
MHRSRVGVLLVDHADEHDAALAFWAGAIGSTPRHLPDEPDFTALGRLGALDLAVQRTGPGTPARLHLDLETDDVAAEVARVVALGARVVADHGSADGGHVVLEDPGGLVFCVVPVQTDRFDDESVTWP